MCGIVGYLPRSEDHAAVGQVVLAMLSALACRGPDSAGVALYGTPQAGRLVVRANLGESGDLSKTAGLVKTATQPFDAADFGQTGVHLRMTVADGNGSGTGP